MKLFIMQMLLLCCFCWTVPVGPVMHHSDTVHHQRNPKGKVLRLLQNNTTWNITTSNEFLQYSQCIVMKWMTISPTQYSRYHKMWLFYNDYFYIPIVWTVIFVALTGYYKSCYNCIWLYKIAQFDKKEYRLHLWNMRVQKISLQS